MWVELGEARGRAPTNNSDGEDDTVDRQFSWRLSVRAEDVGMATGRVGELTEDAVVPVRAVGYTADGDAIVANTTTPITLSNEGPM